MERGATRGDWGGLMGGHCDIVVNSRRRRVSQTASEQCAIEALSRDTDVVK